jgi:aspartyl-tRNA(Asn)/glutamyl-tRNA(Gln) amidotransferase subunit C
MRVTIEDVEKIARLARLELSGEEKEKYRLQMDEMLDYVEQLNTLDTEGVEPTFSVRAAGTGLREDGRTESLPAEEALKNAPARTGGFFRVPKIISKPGPGA